MPRKAQDHLHRLIRSMTATEKRYFKVRRGTSNGVEGHQHLLFDAVAAMPEYDEAALLRRFADQSFTRHFAITKRRLYESVLDSLEAFHAERSPDARMHRALHQADILYQRGLYDDAAKVLHSVRHLATTHHRHGVLLEVLWRTQRLAERGNYERTTDQRLGELKAEGEHLAACFAEINSLWDVKSRVLMWHYRLGRARGSEEARMLEELLEHPLLSGALPARTARGRFLRDQTKAAVAFATGDMERFHTHLFAIHTLMREEPTLFADEPDLVLTVLGNLAYARHRTGRIAQAYETLRELREAPATWGMPDTEDLELKLFVTSTSLEFALASGGEDPHKALELLPMLRRGLARFGERLGPVRRAGLLYQSALALFVAGHHEEAGRDLRELLNRARPGDHGETLTAARILWLFVLWETGRCDLLTYMLRNTERILRRSGREHRFERVCIKLLERLERAVPGDIHQHLREAATALGTLRDDPAERAAFEHFDAEAWVESKLHGLALADMLKARARRLGRAA